MPFDQSELLRKSREYKILEEVMNQSLDRKKKSAFLCHSHKDLELVKGVIVMFREAGIDLYVDWLDMSMPDTPNSTTAKKIQAAIEKREIFLFLATQSAMISRWCPWEIGYADAANRRIYLIQTRDTSSTYGNEYLGLYPGINPLTTKERSGLTLFYPDTKEHIWLTESAHL